MLPYLVTLASLPLYSPSSHLLSFDTSTHFSVHNPFALIHLQNGQKQTLSFDTSTHPRGVPPPALVAQTRYFLIRSPKTLMTTGCERRTQAFFQRVDGVDREVGKTFYKAARPADFNGIDFCSRAKAEMNA